MNPAEESPLRSAMELQGVMMGHHEEDLVNTCQTVECLTVRVAKLTSQFEQIRRFEPSSRHLRQPPPIYLMSLE